MERRRLFSQRELSDEGKSVFTEIDSRRGTGIEASVLWGKR
jgi:hypothetical protein